MGMDVFILALDQYVAMGGGDLMLEVTVGDPMLDPTLLEKIDMARFRREIPRASRPLRMGLRFTDSESNDSSKAASIGSSSRRRASTE